MNLPPCPVCEADSRLILNLPAKLIRERLEIELAVRVGTDMIPADYRMMACQRCTLEFADPMVPASSEFYANLAEKDWYYPGARWEWDETISIIKRKSFKSVVEIGSGSGNFLKHVAESGVPVRAVGVDTSLTAVEAARAIGLEIHHGELPQTGELAGLPMGSFDCAAAFHCLEHVPDPVGLVRDMSVWVRSGGSLLFSTPYSPLTYEGQWRDPLNDPPHHLTRWNAQAFAALGETVGMTARLLSPPAGLAWGRAARSVARGKSSGISGQSRAELIGITLARPWTVLKETVSQRRRDRVNGHAASDVVLLELIKT